MTAVEKADELADAAERKEIEKHSVLRTVVEKMTTVQGTTETTSTARNSRS